MAKASRGFGLLLAPGAGSSSLHPALVAIDGAVSEAGGAVRRMDFPYRLAGRRAPDRMPVLVGSLVSAARALAAEVGVDQQRVYLGGRSMGGRAASLAVAAGLPAAGLVLVSYPLHPPGRPQQVRSEHFGSLTLPCLFVSGTRDAFGAPGELNAALAAVPGATSTVWFDGSDHSLRGRDLEVAETVSRWILARERAGAQVLGVSSHPGPNAR